MTKHPTDENPLKLHVELNKIGDVDTLLVCGSQAGAELEEKIEVVPVRKEMEPKSRLGKIMLELYDLENCVESEKPLKINLDLDLYQMEKV